jgi:hypothetical protein
MQIAEAAQTVYRRATMVNGPLPASVFNPMLVNKSAPDLFLV